MKRADLFPPVPGCKRLRNLFASIVTAASLVAATVSKAEVNSWLKTLSGYWEEPYWSLGVPPNSSQMLEFTNAGWKALAIGSHTVAVYPNSLTVDSLNIQAPADSHNQLLLNYAGFNVPITFKSKLTLGTNASLVSYYTALQGGSFFLSSTSSFSEGSTITFTNIVLQSNTLARLNLTNSSLTATSLTLFPTGTLYQIGGSVQVSDLQLHGTAYYGPSTYYLDGGNLQVARLGVENATFQQTSGSASVSTIEYPPAYPNYPGSQNDFYLSGGTLFSSSVRLGRGTYKHTGDYVSIYQSGGVHSNATLYLEGGELCCPVLVSFGDYLISGGLLVSDMINNYGYVGQSGGTNLTAALNIAGQYRLNSGELMTSNTIVLSYSTSEFVQSGGRHTVQNQLTVQGSYGSSYSMTNGTLTAPAIEIYGDLFLHGGTVSNSETFIFGGNFGSLTVDGPNQELGKLQVVGSGIIYAGNHYPRQSLPTPLPGPPTSIRFQDSRDVSWTGSGLSIYLWSPFTNDGLGPDHIYVGTNTQGLSVAQLSQVRFVNPVGWVFPWTYPPQSYPAQILSTGELVPAVPPRLLFANSAPRLILAWPGNYQLRSATNVTGPYIPIAGARSPFTNDFTDQQRFFELSGTVELP